MHAKTMAHATTNTLQLFDFEINDEDMAEIFKCDTGFRVLKLEQ